MRKLRSKGILAATLLAFGCASNNMTGETGADVSGDSTAGDSSTGESGVDASDANPTDAADVVRSDAVDGSMLDARGDGAADVLGDVATTETRVDVTGDIAADGGLCAQITNDATAIGRNCGTASDCLTGYVCQPFSGVVLAHSCQIRCTRDCECPTAAPVCRRVMDKGGSWQQCAAM